MNDITFLTLEEILAIHHDQIKRYGGSHGVRDLDLLIAAISRPQATFAGEDLYSNVFDKAAAMVQSLILNHPFIDGNKRTAVVGGARFLFLNCYKLRVTNKDLVKFALSVALKELDTQKISSWLKKYSKAVN